MKNNQQQILSEIRSLLLSIKSQVEQLENKIDEYQQMLDIQEIGSDFQESDSALDASVEHVEAESIDKVVETVVDEVMDIELEPSDDLPFYDDITLPASEDVNEEVLDEPVAEPEAESVIEQVKVPVIDAMTAKEAWRTDMPGSAVKDIRSAISLHERILFINYLFGEDPMAFQEMLTQLNAMASFDEAAAHAIAVHPEWDLESDTVYRFMMALRRRHQ